MKPPLLGTLVEPITSPNRCSTDGCGARVTFKVRVPKTFESPGSRYMTRFVCGDCKDKIQREQKK